LSHIFAIYNQDDTDFTIMYH